MNLDNLAQTVEYAGNVKKLLDAKDAVGRTVSNIFTRKETIVQQPVPYQSPLKPPMQIGQMVTVRGRINEDNSDHITINLSTEWGGPACPNIAMHMNVRMDEDQTAFNSRTNYEWGKEEDKECPYKPGDQFDICIRALQDKFQILVNQKEFHEFNYRIPLNKVTHLYVEGPITLNAVTWSMPYECSLENGFRPGKYLLFSGVAGGDCEQFHINLDTDSGDIAFHLNPRFNHKEVVRNSYINGDWGNEEKEGGFPFKHDVGFALAIRSQSDAMEVYLDGERYCTFSHRTDPNRISKLEVVGEDLQLQSAQVLYG